MVNLWRVASCSSAPWFDEAGVADVFSPEPSAKAGKNRAGSESSNDSGFGEGIKGGDDSDDGEGAMYTKSHLLNGSGGGGAEKMASDPPDIKVKSIDQHEDSVYGLAWSACDAWMFCSLSYEGRSVQFITFPCLSDDN